MFLPPPLSISKMTLWVMMSRKHKTDQLFDRIFVFARPSLWIRTTHRQLSDNQSWKRVAGTRGAGRVEILKIAGTRYPRGAKFDPARVARVGFPDIAGSKK